MPRVAVMHVRWPEGYFTDKYPSLVISGYIYSAKGEPLTVPFLGTNASGRVRTMVVTLLTNSNVLGNQYISIPDRVYVRGVL
jgi:hypothetical protein